MPRLTLDRAPGCILPLHVLLLLRRPVRHCSQSFGLPRKRHGGKTRRAPDGQESPARIRALTPQPARTSLLSGASLRRRVLDTAGATYRRTELRVPVWEKEPPGGRIICYCFGESEADMRREIERTGSSDAVGRVRAHIQAGRCACEIRNREASAASAI